MSKRTGLGRGLGAFFGDDYEAPVKKARTSDSQQVSADNTSLDTKIDENAEHSSELLKTVTTENAGEEGLLSDSREQNAYESGESTAFIKTSENEMMTESEKEKTEYVHSAENQADRRHNLEALDMVLPTSTRRKTENKNLKSQKIEKKATGKTAVSKTVPSKTAAGKSTSGKAASRKTAAGTSTSGKVAGTRAEVVKTVETVKIVEVEKEKFLNISLIEPNREQPRKDFDEEQLNELADSIKAYGVLQPLLVQKKGEYYEIIAGERRWRAAKLAGLREVPVVVREYSKQQSMEIALIENLQRADLNPIEEARAYQMLVQEFSLKQEEVAVRVSKNRATITNSMRLLKLDERVQDMLIQNVISSGHARALLVLEDKEQQFQIAGRIVANQLSVREVEKLVKMLTKPQKEKKEPEEEERDLSIFYQDLEEKLKSVMGTKVIINKKDKNKGRIEIEYYSPAELERIAELLQSIQI